jgi:hypothetical protein
MRTLLFVLLALGAGVTASARIHTVHLGQYLDVPTATPMEFTQATAIDATPSSRWPIALAVAWRCSIAAVPSTYRAAATWQDFMVTQ